jgi:hypothetical protein
MVAHRYVRAIFAGATPIRNDRASGVVLDFRPENPRLGIGRIEDFAMLGPEFDVPAVGGLGKVLRILRAARIATPADGAALVDREQEAALLLERAIGTPLQLELRPRSRVRFTAWTDAGVETVEDVTDVLEAPDAYLVMRRKGRFPIRVPRSSVVRQRTECERWYEVMAIERGQEVK